MSWAERLAQLVYLLLWIAIIAVLVLVGRGVVTGTWLWASAVDPQTGTAAFRVETDTGTGCQYVLTPLGGIVPRTGADEKQVCTAKR